MLCLGPVAHRLLVRVVSISLITKTVVCSSFLKGISYVQVVCQLQRFVLALFWHLQRFGTTYVFKLP